MLIVFVLGSPYAPTSNVMPVGKVAEQFPADQQQQQKQTSASAISSNSNTHTNTTVKAGHLDTANGIRTSDLYETGHFEANSDLCGSDAGEHIRNYMTHFQ